MSVRNLQIGYHGCDITVRDGLVSGRLQPAPSNNQYDWLGPGFYMFEDDEDRALAFASAAASEPLRRLTARPIATPSVVGCVYSVQRWLDMTTRAGCLEFESAHLQFQAGYLLSSMRSPLNLPASAGDEEILLRALDRSVFQFIHATCRSRHGHEGYQAVRGAFRQGPEVAPNSGFHRDSHIQIALRDLSCVRGWFLPPGEEQLSQAELFEAQSALRKVKAAFPKARKRVEAD